MAKLRHPIREAERYLENARKILSEKAGKDGDFYTNRNYVRKAGFTAWSGVQIALDATLKVRDTLKTGQQPDIKDYQEAIGKVDNKMPLLLISSYDTLYKALGYDGNPVYKIVQHGLEQAQYLIDWAGEHYHN